MSRLDTSNASIVILRPFDGTDSDGNPTRIYASPADASLPGSGGGKQGRVRAMVQAGPANASGIGATTASDANVEGWIPDDPQAYRFRLTREDEKRVGPLRSGTRIVFDPYGGIGNVSGTEYAAYELPEDPEDLNTLPVWAVVGEAQVFRSGTPASNNTWYRMVRR